MYLNKCTNPSKCALPGLAEYYADFNDATVIDLLRQANIKTKNHLMDFSDSSWQDCPDTGRSSGAYIIFY